MTQLFVFVVQQISSIVQRTLCFNGRVDLLRFRVRADIFVDLPVLLCKGRIVSGELGKDKQGCHTFQPHRETSPHQKSFRAAWASWDVVAPRRWKSIHCSDHRNSRNLPRTRSAKSSHSVNDTPFKREYFCHSHMPGQKPSRSSLATLAAVMASISKSSIVPSLDVASFPWSWKLERKGLFPWQNERSTPQRPGENDGAEDAALARPLPFRWEWRIIDNRKKVVMMTRPGSV